ncbi:hypothetical protein HanIR_Chr14g0672891 [Helianthus annuus]|nr:hypothetical protein HanIR_Chr14g0672891 [Helianthus annuus]
MDGLEPHRARHDSEPRGRTPHGSEPRGRTPHGSEPRGRTPHGSEPRGRTAHGRARAQKLPALNDRAVSVQLRN